MTTIGTAVLQIIPSLDGVSKSIDTQLGGTLRASGKTGGKQFAKGVGEGLKDLEREVESAGRAYEKLKDKASDALGKVRSDEAALQRLRNTGASDDRVIRAEERLATSRRNSSRASRDAEDSHKALQTAQGALAGSTDDLGQKFGSMANLAGLAGTALAGAGAIAGGAALAGIAALGTGVVVVGRQLYDLGEKFDDVFDNLRLKTGATGPALQELENATKRIASNVPESIGDIGDVVAETSRAFKGLSGSDFDDLASHLANLNRLTGENVNVRELGKAYRIMGVDVKDQVPTLDAFFRANETSGISVNELIGTINRGGAQLKTFGLNMASSAALVSSFETAGVDASKVIPGLTKALAGFAKSGTDPKKGLADTITQIKALADAGDETGSLDLANKVFGAKGGIAFAEVIKSGNLDLQTLNDSLSTTGDTIDQAASDTDDWAETWQKFKNHVEVAVQPLASGVFDAVNGQLEGFSNTVLQHEPEIIGFFTKIGEVAVSMAEFVIKSVGMVSEGLGELLSPLAATLSVILKGAAEFERIGGFNDLADKLDGAADSLTGATQGLVDFGEKAKNVSLSGLYNDIKNAGQQAQDASKLTRDLGTSISLLPDQKTIVLSAPSDDAIAAIDKTKYDIQQIPGTKDFRIVPKTDEATTAVNAWIAQQTGKTASLSIGANLAPASQDVKQWGDKLALGAGITIPVHAGPVDAPLHVGDGHATGGQISGPGSGVSDSILARVSNGEFIVNANATRKNLPLLEIINSDRLPGFATGGVVGSDVSAAEKLVGTPYSMPKRFDCSGDVARVINAALGLSDAGGLMTTRNASEWLAHRGFKPGLGGPGTISVGWKNGGPGGGHMAMTLSDGRNAEGGGSHPNFMIGGAAAGASSPQFTDHMFLPLVAAPATKADTTGQGADSAAPASADSPATSSSGGGVSLPGSISGLSSFAFAGLGKGVGTTGSGSDLGAFGDAAATAVSGEVSSLLGVFGAGDTPPFLQAASKLLGGIKVGGHAGPGKSDGSLFDGSNLFGQGHSAAPLSASSTGTAASLPDEPHGTRAGQAPGPVFNTTISAFDTTDALRMWDNKKNQLLAAKTTAY